MYISYHINGGFSMAMAKFFLGVRKSFQKMHRFFIFSKKCSPFPWQKPKKFKQSVHLLWQTSGIFESRGFFWKQVSFGKAAGVKNRLSPKKHASLRPSPCLWGHTSQIFLEVLGWIISKLQTIGNPNCKKKLVQRWFDSKPFFSTCKTIV